jgi:hypothetical protein
MTFPELIWRTIELTFSDLPHFLGMMVIVVIIRGGMEKAAGRIKKFVSGVKIRYQEKLADRKLNNIPERKT